MKGDKPKGEICAQRVDGSAFDTGHGATGSDMDPNANSGSVYVTILENLAEESGGKTDGNYAYAYAHISNRGTKVTVSEAKKENTLREYANSNVWRK